MPLNIKSSANGILRSVLILILLILHNSSHANDDEFKDDFQYYVGGYAGFSMPREQKFYITDIGDKFNSTTKGSFIFCLLVGHEISQDTGLELSLDYKSNDPLSINNANPLILTDPNYLNTKITTLLLNIKYDLTTFDKIKPYITAGVGGSYVNINVYNISQYIKLDSSFAFACQIGLGFNYKINNDISFDTSLRLQRINNLNIEYRISGTKKFQSYEYPFILKGMIGFKFCF